MKKKKGCEIEAKCINYTVNNARKQMNQNHPFRIWSREEEESIASLPQSQLPAATTRTRTRHILKNVSCRAKPWEILAIVGPSGAGKSTLLEILAGRVAADYQQSSSSSEVFVNQKAMDRVRFKKISGYVTQKDVLFPLLTVEETLMYSARLRLGFSDDHQLLHEKVHGLIQELGLKHVAGSRIGNEKVRGISGGERRRVSIGVEVIHDPSVLILDEPTSGLDSTSALQIIDMLKLMAEIRGRTVILSIHQPGFKIIKLFNSVLLMANGSVLHHGTVDQLNQRFTSAGMQIPVHVNIIEYAIDSIDELQKHNHHHDLHSTESQIGDLEERDHYDTAGRKGKLQQLFQLNPPDYENKAGILINNPAWTYANSRIGETVMLAERLTKNTYRTKELFACRTISMLIAGLVLGSIFYNLKRDRVGAQERVGLFAFVLTFLLSTTVEALPIFLQEREIVMKEISSGSYRISSYAIANGIVFLPFLLILALLFSVPLYWLVGLTHDFNAFLYFVLIVWLILYTANSVVACFSALVPNFIIGNSVISGVLGSFFLFSGYFISKDEIPSYWMFMHYISLFKYPFEALLVNEFSGWEGCLEFRYGSCLIRGEDLLREQGLEEAGSRWRDVMLMISFILAYRFFSYIILRCRCLQGGFRRLLV